MRWGVTPNFTLNGTIRPDFSQVEVDEQVTNLDRFELSFPERRQSFVENSDLLARFGFPRIRPFFSRRIGLARDPDTGLAVPQPILYGARLSGELDNGFGYLFQTNFTDWPAILNAQIKYRFSGTVAMSAGQFKAPFSYEFLTYGGSIDFVNRATMVTALAPGRQVGADVTLGRKHGPARAARRTCGSAKAGF